MSERIDTTTLRNKILNLAFSGKLVKQDPNDEPASILLERIKKEKETLVKEGKIKKSNQESIIFKGDDNHYYENVGSNLLDITNAISFETPINWCWSRGYRLYETIEGYTFKSNKYTRNGIKIIRISDFDSKGICGSDFKRYAYSTKFNNYKIKCNDLLICMTGGTVGKNCIINKLDEDCYINQRVAIIRSCLNVNPKYIYFYYNSSHIKHYISSRKNSTNDNISIADIKSLLIPLPPLAEQERIVNKIEELFSEIDKIEKAQDELDNLKEMARTKVLDLAVRGKLVKQDPNDEPASLLLEKIKQEKEKLIKEGKIKRDKNKSVIYKGDDKNYYEKIGNKVTNITEEIPFEIPINWRWVRQSVICWLDNGIKSKGQSLPYLEAKTIRGQQETKYISEGVLVKPKQKVILVDGENSGEVMDVPYDGYMGSTFRILERSSLIDYDYLSYFFLLNKNTYRDNKKGAAIPHLNKTLFANMLIPLPPSEEQKKIAMTLDNIFRIIS